MMPIACNNWLTVGNCYVSLTQLWMKCVLFGNMEASEISKLKSTE